MHCPAQGITRCGRGNRVTQSGAAGAEAPAGMRATPDPVPERCIGGEAGIVIQRRRRATGLDCGPISVVSAEAASDLIRSDIIDIGFDPIRYDVIDIVGVQFDRT